MKIKMKKGLMVMMMIGMTAIAGCSRKNDSGEKESLAEKGSFVQISPQEAKKIMDTQENIIILDVRTESEYSEGHIPGAILIPDMEIGDRAEEELTDKDQTILVYCRSGRRSKNAARELCSLGYTDVREFGGIIDWPYEIVK